MLPITIDNEITLRLLTSKDSESLSHLIDRNRAYLRHRLPWLDYSKSKSDSEIFIKDQNEKWKRKEALTLGIEYNNNLVGIISFHEFDWQTRTSGIGYWIDETHQAKGIVTRACHAIVNFGFLELNLDSISISCATDNISSKKIPERLHFNLKEYIENKEWLYDHFVSHHVYLMTRSRWEEIMLEKSNLLHSG